MKRISFLYCLLFLALNLLLSAHIEASIRHGGESFKPGITKSAGKRTRVPLSDIFKIGKLLNINNVNASGEGKHLFILSGQSNMARMNPELSFIPMIDSAFGKDNVIIIKDAQGGQPIRRWYKKWRPVGGDIPESNGDLYDRLIKKIKEAIKGETLATVTFVWMQGERDAKEGHGEVYEASLKGLLDQLSGDLGRNDINFVVGRISDYGVVNKIPDWPLVRKAQVNVAESYPRGTWVNTDDLNDGINKKGEPVTNDLHCTPEGFKKLGQRFAEAAIELIKENN